MHHADHVWSSSHVSHRTHYPHTYSPHTSTHRHIPHDHTYIHVPHIHTRYPHVLHMQNVTFPLSPHTHTHTHTHTQTPRPRSSSTWPSNTLTTLSLPARCSPTPVSGELLVTLSMNWTGGWGRSLMPSRRQGWRMTRLSSSLLTMGKS